MFLGLAGMFLLLMVGVALAEEITGKVKAVDSDKNTITVTANDKDTTFKCKDAKFTAGKKDIAIGDIKPGDNVVVTYKDDVASKVAKKKK
jgi:hypothetical protein